MTSYLPEVLRLVLSAYGKEDDSSGVIESRGILLRTITEKLDTDVCVENLSASWSSVPRKRKVSCLFIVANNRRLPCLPKRSVGLLRLDLAKI